MKKIYVEPEMQAVKIKAGQLLAGSPIANDEEGDDQQLAPTWDNIANQFGGWTPWDEE